MTYIKLAGIVNDSIVDGEGYRYTIFVQGCPHHCNGCHNPQTHDFLGGYDGDIEDLFDQIKENPILSGVTFSGGEPFCQCKPLITLAKKVHSLGLDVWTFTGYTFEELSLLQNEDVISLLAETDILVDGRFDLAKKDLSLAFRGSSNQRIIDMSLTRKAGYVIEKAL